MRPTFVIFSFLLLILASPQRLLATELTFTGFGSVGYSLMLDSTDGEIYDQQKQKYVPKEHGVYWGTDKKGGFDRDTRFGLNMNATITDRLYLAAQVYGESAQQNSGTLSYFNTRFSLMALGMHVNDNFSWRLGMVQVPLWLISEEKYIGLTFPYIRPPSEVVGIVRVGDTLRGASFAYQDYAGDLLYRLRTSFGSFNHDEPIYGNASINTRSTNLFTNFEFEYQNIYLSLGLHAFKGTASEVSTVATKTNGVIVLTDVTGPTDFTGRNLGLGLRADFEKLLVMAEYNTQNNYFNDAGGPAIGLKGGRFFATGKYILLGYKLTPRWMPRIHVARFDWTLGLSDDAVDNHFNNVVLPNLEPAQVGIARAIFKKLGKQGVEDFLTYPKKQTTVNVGVNYLWDELGSVIIKAELEHAMADDDGAGGMFGLLRGGDVTTFSTAIDFIFY